MLGLSMFDIGKQQEFLNATDIVWPSTYLVSYYYRTSSMSNPLCRRNVKKQQAAFTPVSVIPILGTSPNCSVLSASIRPNGAPVIQLSTGIAHSYDPSLLSWTKLSDGWWAEGSDAWQGRQRVNTQVAARGIVSIIEGSIAERILSTDDEKTRPTWWTAAMTLGHLESKMHAAKTLDSPQEYKHALAVYAKKIADEGFRAKAEELVKELFGPTYW